MRKKQIYFLILMTCTAVSCDSHRQYEDYKLKTAGDLTLTLENHPHGYQRYECFLCHHPENIHRENRIGAPNYDLAEGLVLQSGLQSCRGCHGKNGAL
jgi:hypothetical protein